MTAAASALAALAAVAALLLAASGQQVEDRPLPASPCPDVFSYEGATVDWDRWYGVVLVATDTPLTGLRLDVWLSRPALALRHNWDGNVTTLDNKRFTILNLYKRIEPGPPKSVRIVVKFDEKEEIPVLRAVELNGRRICSSRSGCPGDAASMAKVPTFRSPFCDLPQGVLQNVGTFAMDAASPGQPNSHSYAERPRQPSRRRPDYSLEDELPLSHSAPSNSKYNFDRTTQRAAPAAHAPAAAPAHRNAVGKRPPSNVADEEYERAAAPGRRPPFADDADERTAEDEYQARPAPPPYQPATATDASEGWRPPGLRKPQAAPPRGPPPAPASAPVRRPPAPPPAQDDDYDQMAPPPYEEAAAAARRPADPPIDVRFGPAPAPATPAHATRPPRQPARAAGPPGLEKRGGVPPGHGGVPPGHGGVPPGHNKGEAQWQATTEPSAWAPSPAKPTSAPPRPPHAPGGGEACGRTLSVTPLITHGQNTSRGQWPWHAALYQVKGADLKYICGGTLVSSKHVVTAAHCVTRPTTGRAVDPDTIIAYLGKYHLHRWTNEEGVQQGKVAAIHVHPQYNTSDFRADVAVLELSTRLAYTQYVRHVCMWGAEESADLSHVVNKEGYVVGWGYDEFGELTEELRMASMPIVSEQTCLRSYPEFYSRFSNERTFCAGYKNGTSACNGDSGGGLVVARGAGAAKTWVLRGLVSVSVSRDDHRVCNTQHYVVFTDLAKHRDWIANYVR